MGMPDVDEVEQAGAAEAILREFGSVIGENEARNIAYYALLGARAAKIRAEQMQFLEDARDYAQRTFQG